MKYYKLGCQSDVNSRPIRVYVNRRREQELEARIAGFQLPEPWPTILLWVALSVGAILYFKSGMVRKLY